MNFESIQNKIIELQKMITGFKNNWIKNEKSWPYYRSFIFVL